MIYHYESTLDGVDWSSYTPMASILDGNGHTLMELYQNHYMTKLNRYLDRFAWKRRSKAKMANFIKDNDMAFDLPKPPLPCIYDIQIHSVYDVRNALSVVALHNLSMTQNTETFLLVQGYDNCVYYRKPWKRFTREYLKMALNSLELSWV